MRQLVSGWTVGILASAALLAGCDLSQGDSVSRSARALAGTDTLYAGERLYPNEAISSGSTSLVYQGDNNLVLYQNGAALWATNQGVGWPTDRFEMQGDCNAVVYSGSGYVWASGTAGQGSNCYARVTEGDWFICSGSSRVFSARGGGDCSGGGGSTTEGGAEGYVGCFTDDSNRALPAAQGSGYSIQACIDQCRNLGYAYSGSQWYSECFCGNNVAYSQVGDGECNTPCSYGDGYCGGAWRNSIYETGASTTECWYCDGPNWKAWTSYRAIQNPTRWECGAWTGTCGDSSHSNGPSWVDIAGGISQECDDHSTSFLGPQDGEWHGCSLYDSNWQESSGWQWIDSVNQNWDRWPTPWNTARRSPYHSDLSIMTETRYMNEPFASVYDLDTCTNKQIIGSIYWGNFPVTGRVLYDSPDYKSFRLEGYGSSQCSQDGWEYCKSPVCSDLWVEGDINCSRVDPSECRTAVPR